MYPFYAGVCRVEKEEYESGQEDSDKYEVEYRYVKFNEPVCPDV